VVVKPKRIEVEVGGGEGEGKTLGTLTRRFTEIITFGLF
jgi:hypothetical protein